jgi:hypothetical protein
MRRRSFLAMAAMTATGFRARTVLARDVRTLVRAGVVIGVNKTGDLPTLNAAASDAHTVADWLQSERFRVKLLVDDHGPVTAAQVFDAIDQFVEREPLDQLVVYFSGHGFISQYAEYWMLSNAPKNPNEAISLRESVELARMIGVPSVVFISDACRSKPDSLGAERVRGSLVFPNAGPTRSASAEVDQFLATLVGDAALEVSVDTSVASFQGLYTAVFLDAFRDPGTDMVRTVDGVAVVPDRALKAYLAEEVPKRARAKAIRLRQMPDSIVESDYATYIGRAVFSNLERRPNVAAPPPVHNETTASLQHLGVALPSTVSPVLTEAIDRVAKTIANPTGQPFISGFGSKRQIAFDTETGFTISGASVVFAAANPKMGEASITQGGGSHEPALIRIDPHARRPCSVALQFKNGSGAIVAALLGYVGTIVVDDNGVANVSYTPSANNWRWSRYKEQQRDFDEFHAAVAAAARFGVFRVEGTKDTRVQQATELAGKIRVLKSVDPTLGLYAAYAYAEVDLIEDVRSVRSAMHDDLEADLFDVALLAGALGGKPPMSDSVVPFCPMLSQGWSLLRVRSVSLPPPVARARDHLRQALWTSFGPDGMSIIISSLRSGELI